MTAQAGDTFLLKQTLRRQVRARRLLIPLAQRRRAGLAAAAVALRALLPLRPRCVALYLAYGSELATLPLIRALQRHGIRVAVPRMRQTGQMHFEQFRSQQKLRRNPQRVLEPALRGRRVLRGECEAVLLPLLGFDRHGTRLGSGGGYYDRWLQGPRLGRRPLYLGYAYALQELEHIPREPWDVALDAVITEQGVRWLTG